MSVSQKEIVNEWGEPADRPLHEFAKMKRLLAPKSIAVVGVSTREGSFGKRTWDNLSGFSGNLYAVHPSYRTYSERECYASLSELPEIPDCVVICTGREQVEALVAECAALRVGGVVIYASGYSETGLAERRADQQRLIGLAHKGDTVLLGPNCMGYIQSEARAAATFAPKVDIAEAKTHAIGLVSQSGAIGFALLQAAEHGTSFSHMLTSGNASDVDAADQIAYLAEDPACRGIACVLESIPSSRRLIEAGQKAHAAGKPVVVYKVARTPVGAEAAQSHTGALMASDATSRAIFRAAGMVMVDDLEHLLEAAVFLTKAAKLPSLPDGVAVLTASGGLGIIAADSAYEASVSMPQPSEGAVEKLKVNIPPFGSPRNPCDVTAQVVNDLGSLRACAGILLAEAEYGILVYPHTGAHEAGIHRLRTIEREAAAKGKMACFVWSTSWLEGPGASDVEEMEHGAIFRSMRACFHAIKALQALRKVRACQPCTTSDGNAEARKILQAVQSHCLTEGESMAVLRAGGLPVVEDKVVHSARDAKQAAMAMGRPFAMKIVSRDIAHKSDVGGVILDLHTPAEASSAYEKIVSSIQARLPSASIDGVVLQPMIPKGIELILGARRDPVAGTLVMIGFGGVLTELLSDVAVRLAPCTAEDAMDMLSELRGRKLFDGFRGLPAVDKLKLANVIADFSKLASSLGNSFADMEINPLICLEREVIAVDALIRKFIRQSR